jgi:hypothetical protein
MKLYDFGLGLLIAFGAVENDQDILPNKQEEKAGE